VRYNCIAFAFGDVKRWWWPDGANYWPLPIQSRDVAAEFERLLRHFAFMQVTDGSYKKDSHTIAVLYQDGEPLHACRQISENIWVSKMGRNFDIHHSPPGVLLGQKYGNHFSVFRRSVP